MTLPSPTATLDSASCPHCGQRVDASRPGEIHDCPHCDHSYAARAVPAGAASVNAATEGPSRLAGSAATHPSAVSDIWTAGSALIATAVFYAAIVRPFPGTTIGELFGARGWVPVAISFLGLWSIAILGLKWRRLREQRRSLSLDALPLSIAEIVTHENAELFERFLASLAQAHPDSLLLRRLSQGIAHFRVRKRSSDVRAHLAAQAEADSLEVDASYSLVRVFIWAIPILGFIGTVIGIGAAVGSFSTSVAAAVDLEVMQRSIGGVTSGLGVAFDTTLVALVISVLLMLPATVLQRAEEDVLLRIDRFCLDKLMPRLDPGHEGSEIARLADAISTLDRKLG